MPRVLALVTLNGYLDVSEGKWEGSWTFQGSHKAGKPFSFSREPLDPDGTIHPASIGQMPTLVGDESVHPASAVRKIRGHDMARATFWSGSFVVGDAADDTMDETFCLFIESEEGPKKTGASVRGYGENAAGRFEFHGTLGERPAEGNRLHLTVVKRYLPKKPRRSKASSPSSPGGMSAEESPMTKRTSARKRSASRSSASKLTYSSTKQESSSPADKSSVSGKESVKKRSGSGAGDSKHSAKRQKILPKTKSGGDGASSVTSGSALSSKLGRVPGLRDDVQGWVPPSWLVSACESDWSGQCFSRAISISKREERGRVFTLSSSLKRHFQALYSGGMRVYEGEVQHGALHGYGTAIYSDGTMVEGYWKEGQPHGMAVISDALDRTLFEGEMEEGKPQGYGIWFLHAGVGGTSRYEGEWRDGVFEGRGKIITPNGYRYLGEWLGGVPHGKGVMYTPDGGFYVGEWVKGRPEGKGDLSLQTGLKYHGGWKEGLFHGRGNCEYPHGCCYEGSFLEGKKEGRGILTYPNQSMYTGRFKNDRIEGAGTMLIPKPATGRDGDWVIPIELQDISRIHRRAGFSEEGV